MRFLRDLWPLLDRRTRRRLGVGVVSAAVVAILDTVGVVLIFPLTRLLGQLDSTVVPSDLRFLSDLTGVRTPTGLAVLLGVSMVACFVGKGVLALATLRFTLTTSLNAEAVTVRDLLTGYLGASLEFHLGHNSAELQRTIQESTRRIFQEALVTAVPALGDRLIIIAVAIALVVLAPIEALVGACSMAVVIWFYRQLTVKRTIATSSDMLEQTRRSFQYVQQALGAVREIQVSGRVDYFTTKLLAVRERVADRQRTITLTEMLPRYYLELGTIVVASLVGTVAFVRHPSSTAVALLALFLGAGLRLLPSLNRMMVATAKANTAGPHLQQLIAELAEIREDQGVALDSAAVTENSGEPFRRLELRDVGFRYRGRTRRAVDRVSFTVNRGDRLVLVGRSGSGKTTTLGLLLGLLDPAEGEILVDDVPLSGGRTTWRGRLAYVPQETAILDATIEQNIAFGIHEHEIDRARVHEATELAQLTDVVRRLPHGLETLVGEGGSALSGGQRQRLGLARALYGRPEVLVLDEVTSALDGETEARVLDVIDRLPSDMTVIAVSHKPAAMRRFRTAVLLVDGAVAASGPVQAVLASSHYISESDENGASSHLVAHSTMEQSRA